MKKIAIILLICCAACSNRDKQNAVKLTSADSGTIKFSGLDIAIVNDIERDSSTTKWQNLLPVYRMPADTSLINYVPVQPGTYRVVKNEIIFLPDTPFIRGQTYFSRYYLYAEGNSVWDIIRNGDKPGRHPHSDLIFKP